ncbi:hypothetical protein [Aureibacter tunicatorum]|uniref:Uncharacterized protein n=1 Tax=Aureibacter tunicatorum TaxID=866807 RepID=A0AAE3XRW0_9BACT|nr:hypothetical protein [Aureibacter tunicatorum]MDR6241623.1 hypothetical protein [Aureibacter tunicatorum]BDD07155.1 hypothetical protein AUTU_46380 [Aureibacter tunicatorum]
MIKIINFSKLEYNKIYLLWEEGSISLGIIHLDKKKKYDIFESINFNDIYIDYLYDLVVQNYPEIEDIEGQRYFVISQDIINKIVI